MFNSYDWAYLVGDLLFVPLWLVLFWRADVRREMLSVGLWLGFAAIFAEPWSHLNYWHPESLNALRYTLGAFCYGFLAGGVAAALYEVLFRKHFRARANHSRPWARIKLLLVLLCLALSYASILLHINFIYSVCTSLFIVTGTVVYFRRDLFVDALFSGFFFTLATIGYYLIFLALFPGIIAAWWDLSNISGFLFLGIPIEELLFAFALGMAAGPIQEFSQGLVFRKRPLRANATRVANLTRARSSR